MIVDMHVHTLASGDSLIAAEDLVEQALELGLDAICVTEHNSYDASSIVLELAEGTSLKVFRGVEATTPIGHLLLYGVTDDGWRDYLSAKSRDVQPLIEYVRSVGGVVVPAHPFDPLHPSVGEQITTLAGIFALEGFNGQVDVNENLQAQSLADRHNLKMLGGSDAHTVQMVGRCVTDFEAEVDSMPELVQELKAGRFAGRYL